MSKIQLLELLQQDIKDINGLMKYDKYGLQKEKAKNLARGILLNLNEHLKAFIK